MGSDKKPKKKRSDQGGWMTLEYRLDEMTDQAREHYVDDIRTTWEARAMDGSRCSVCSAWSSRGGDMMIDVRGQARRQGHVTNQNGGTAHTQHVPACLQDGA